MPEALNVKNSQTNYSMWFPLSNGHRCTLKCHFGDCRLQTFWWPTSRKK